MQGEPLPEWVETDLLHTNTYTIRTDGNGTTM